MGLSVLPHLTHFRARLSRLGDKLRKARTPQVISKEQQSTSSIIPPELLTTSPAPTPPCTPASPAFSYRSRIKRNHKPHSDSKLRYSMVQHQTVRLDPVERAWFQRRKSSLNRLSASSMKFRETIHSPRPENESELVPYVLGADPTLGPYTTNITMEMVDMIASSLTPVFAIPPNTPNKIPEATTGTTETEAKIWAPALKPLALDASGPNDTFTSPYPSPQYHSKRPAPINVNNRAPAKLEQSTCDISDTPFSQLNMAGMYPDTPDTAYTFRELTYWNQRRQSTLSHRTAKTAKSSFIYGWWK